MVVEPASAAECARRSPSDSQIVKQLRGWLLGRTLQVHQSTMQTCTLCHQEGAHEQAVQGCLEGLKVRIKGCKCQTHDKAVQVCLVLTHLQGRIIQDTPPPSAPYMLNLVCIHWAPPSAHLCSMLVDANKQILSVTGSMSTGGAGKGYSRSSPPAPCRQPSFK
jgi:hypothetical protein